MSTKDADPAQSNMARSTESITDHQTKCLRMGSVLKYRGPYRVYFNRKEDAPRVVSIDNGSHAWEILCKSVILERQDLKSSYDAAKAYPDPSFVLSGFGTIEVNGNGYAVIS